MLSLVGVHTGSNVTQSPSTSELLKPFRSIVQVTLGERPRGLLLLATTVLISLCSLRSVTVFSGGEAVKLQQPSNEKDFVVKSTDQQTVQHFTYLGSSFFSEAKFTMELVVVVAAKRLLTFDGSEAICDILLDYLTFSLSLFLTTTTTQLPPPALQHRQSKSVPGFVCDRHFTRQIENSPSHSK